MTVDRCSFCTRTRDEVNELVVGPYVTICDVCIEAANRLVDDVAGSPMQVFDECTFCGHREARGQFTSTSARGPFARNTPRAGSEPAGEIRVCDTCICLCVEILAEQRAARTLPTARLIKG